MDAPQQRERRRRTRIHRPRKHILNVYEDAELVMRHRLDREGILLVCDMVSDAISSKTNKCVNKCGNEGGHNTAVFAYWENAALQW